MKNTIQKVFLALIGAFISLAAAAPAASAAGGGSADLSLVPSSSSYNVGDSVSIAIYEDSGSDSVNVVQANFNYPTSQLTFVSISSAPNYGIDAQDFGSGGQVKVGRGANPAVTGLQLVATVRFTAAAAGSITLNLIAAPTSGVYKADGSGTPETLSTSPANFTINAPPPPPPPPPTPTPTPSPSPSPRPAPPPSSSSKSNSSNKPSSNSSSASPPPAAPQVLTITSISASGVSAHSATINWKTSVPATAEVDYGIGTQYIFSAIEGTPATDHSLPLDAANLVANSCYHYVIKAMDAKGNQAVSQDQSFATKANSTCASINTPAKSSNKKGVNWAVIIIVLIIVILLIGGGSPPGRRLLRRFKSGTNNNDPGPIGVAPIIMNSSPGTPGPSGSAPPSTTIKPSTTVMPSADQDGHGTPGSVISPGPKA